MDMNVNKPDEPQVAKDEVLYASRVKIHPQKISGLFRQLKWAALGILLAIYYGLPWLRWDR
ncbi:MAG: cytochrome c oxidase accessory protein CcoG, partial [Rhodospirillaceae bacterium]|nr:cytochrome c oxidase accessory protein CcoG [Rhodospirillaceae bacterium]